MIVDAPKKTKRATRFSNSKAESLSKVVSLEAKTQKQKEYLAALRGPNVVVAVGYSGTGKSYMAAAHAANLYLTKEIDKIILTRPNVAVGKDLGFLPGELVDKFQPWVMPILDTLIEVMGKGVVETAIKNGNIEFAPLAYMRGRSFQNAFIILDEASNTTVQEMVMFLTRIGDNTKVVVNGDVLQQDIKGTSGLQVLLDMSKKYSIDVDLIEFGVDDIVRSPICKQFVIAFTKEGLM
jgi:phosphate starvation-inducible PhoH-like protein